MNFEDTFLGRAATVRAYKSLYGKWIRPYVTGLGPSHYNEQKAIQLLKVWQANGLSWRTRQSLLRLLSKHREFIVGAPLDIKPLLRHLDREEQQEELIVLNKDEAATLMKNCKRIEPNFYPILLLGLHAGLRRGEVFGLRCGDIDMLNNRIRVARSYDGPTKNGRTRYVPMTKELADMFCGPHNLLLRPVNEKVFRLEDPNPKLRRLLFAQRAPELRFHDLRHTFATLGLENGVSAKQMATWLGHSSPTTTISLYWNLTKDEDDINRFTPSVEDSDE